MRVIVFMIVMLMSDLVWADRYGIDESAAEGSWGKVDFGAIIICILGAFVGRVVSRKIAGLENKRDNIRGGEDRYDKIGLVVGFLTLPALIWLFK